MKKSISRMIALFLLLALLQSLTIAEAAPATSIMFESCQVAFFSSGAAKFSASLSQMCSSVNVTSCTLEKQVGTRWVFDKALPHPDGASNTDYYQVAKDYSSSLTKGTTYRIVATFEANGEQVATTSAKMLYQ